METLLVTIHKHVDIEVIEKALHEMEGVFLIKRIASIDETTLLSESGLSEEWESAEDQRWDHLI